MYVPNSTVATILEHNSKSSLYNIIITNHSTFEHEFYEEYISLTGNKSTQQSDDSIFIEVNVDEIENCLRSNHHVMITISQCFTLFDKIEKYFLKKWRVIPIVVHLDSLQQKINKCYSSGLFAKVKENESKVQKLIEVGQFLQDKFKQQHPKSVLLFQAPHHSIQETIYQLTSILIDNLSLTKFENKELYYVEKHKSQAYVETSSIEEILEHLLCQLFFRRPTDPIHFMKQQLKLWPLQKAI